MSEADQFKEQVSKLKASKEVKGKINREIDRFKNAAGMQAEAGVIRSYIETLLSLPWDKVSRDNKNLAKAKKILEEDHYGLEKVKRAYYGISGCANPDEKGRESDSLSGRTAGNRKDFYCTFRSQGA